MGKGYVCYKNFTLEYKVGTYEVTHCEDYNMVYDGCTNCPFYAGCKIPEKINPSKRK